MANYDLTRPNTDPIAVAQFQQVFGDAAPTLQAALDAEKKFTGMDKINWDGMAHAVLFPIPLHFYTVDQKVAAAKHEATVKPIIDAYQDAHDASKAVFEEETKASRETFEGKRASAHNRLRSKDVRFLEPDARSVITAAHVEHMMVHQPAEAAHVERYTTAWEQARAQMKPADDQYGIDCATAFANAATLAPGAGLSLLAKTTGNPAQT